LSHALGLWILFSAFCLFVSEQALYDRDVSRALDDLDLSIDSEVQKETSEHFRNLPPEQRRHAPMGATPLAAAIAPDIKRKIMLRLAEQGLPEDNETPKTLDRQDDGTNAAAA
jgi:hypothetical protein